MADGTHIEWTDATWPVVQGCDYESPGCTHCYAAPLLWRMAHHPDPKISAPLQGVVAKSEKGKLHFTGRVALREDRLDWPLKWRSPRRIFVPSHGDLFHQAVPDEWIDRVFAVMALAPQHTFQCLTKRSARMLAYFSAYDRVGLVWDAAFENVKARFGIGAAHSWNNAHDEKLPLPNVWLGCSVEDQQRADERIPDLLATPAAKRFLSCEPLLGPIDLNFLAPPDGDKPRLLRPQRLNALTGARGEHGTYYRPVGAAHIDWVIVGGESGPNARPMHPDWARSLRDQCQAAGVAFYFKQWGAWLPGENLGPGKNPVWPLAVWQDGNEGKHPSPDHIEWRHFGTPGEFGAFTIRVGKKAAGRLLDGHEWSEFPA